MVINLFLVTISRVLAGISKLQLSEHDHDRLNYYFKEHNTIVLNIMADTDYWLVPKNWHARAFSKLATIIITANLCVDAQHPHSSPIMGLTLSDVLDLNTLMGQKD